MRRSVVSFSALVQKHSDFFGARLSRLPRMIYRVIRPEVRKSPSWSVDFAGRRVTRGLLQRSAKSLWTMEPWTLRGYILNLCDVTSFVKVRLKCLNVSLALFFATLLYFVMTCKIWNKPTAKRGMLTHVGRRVCSRPFYPPDCSHRCM